MKYPPLQNVLAGFLLLWSFSVRAQSFGDPGYTYDILGNQTGEQFTSPVPGGNFNARSFDLLSQVLDKNKGKFYWESTTAVGTENGDLYLRDYDTSGTTPNVGIGPLSAPTAKLHIKGDDALETSAALYVYNSTQTQGNPSLAVKNNGYVGIGTASPSGPLHVTASTVDDLDGGGIILEAQNSNATTPGTYGAGDIEISAGDGLGTIGSASGGDITLSAGDTLNYNTTAGDIVLQSGRGTVNGGGYNFGNIIMLSNQGTDIGSSGDLGYVGIGFDTPTARLHIKGHTNDSSGMALQIDDKDDAVLVAARNDGKVGIGLSTSLEAKLHIKGDDVLSGTESFRVENSTSPIFVVENDGNVGIGTDTPSADLDIQAPDGYTSPYTYLSMSHDTEIDWDLARIGNHFNIFGGGSSYLTIAGATSGDVEIGNVGIGTTSPEETLHVDGTVRVSVFTGTDPDDNAVCRNSTTGNLEACTSPMGGLWQSSSGTLSPKSSSDVKVELNGTQVAYVPDQTDFAGTMVIGNGGGSLSHSTGENGQKNTIVGIGAGNSMTTGESNTTLGYNALNSVTTGRLNIAIGENAVKNNTTSVGNVGVGAFSLHYTTSGSNIGIGTSAGAMITTGEDNIAIGAGALNHATTNKTGSGNIAIGTGMTGSDLTSGTDNILIGNSIGNITTGSNNILIGDLLDAQSDTADDQLSIGNLIFGSGGFGTGNAIGIGKIGIREKTPITTLDVNGNVRIEDLTVTGSKLVTATPASTGSGNVLGGGAWLCYSKDNNTGYLENISIEFSSSSTNPGPIWCPTTTPRRTFNSDCWCYSI